MAKPAKSNVKPFQIDWPRSYWWGLRTAPIPAAGVDKPLVKRARTLVLVLIAASALTWAVFMTIHGLS